ncbi:MAG: hypothetical protein P8174_00535 [Gemmatimonadota bacterium]
MNDPLKRTEAGAPHRSGDGPRPGSVERYRSFFFVERPSERWTVFLVTYPGTDGRWRGYFSFRNASVSADEEIRTADLFVEATEAEVDVRARSLGRPLLESLLDSALHVAERRRDISPDMRRWFREVLASRAGQLSLQLGTDTEALSLTHLRSLYDSYRIDQVVHLIALVEPAAFEALVERLLDGREIDFRAGDRLQLAMIVVQEIERRLPLPPFEVWVEDYMSDPEVYHLYSHTLHREQALP